MFILQDNSPYCYVVKKAGNGPKAMVNPFSLTRVSFERECYFCFDVGNRSLNIF